MATKSRTYNKTLTLSKEDVYTAPSRFEAVIKSILISNITATRSTISVDFYKSLDLSTTELIKDLIVEPNSIVQIDSALHLEVKDALRASASAATSLVVSLLVEESNVSQIGI